jgi:hypothetical protein
VKRVTLALLPGLLVGLMGIFLVYQFVDSPKEAALRRENQQLLVQYELLNKQLARWTVLARCTAPRRQHLPRDLRGRPAAREHAPAGNGGREPLRDLAGFASSEW